MDAASTYLQELWLAKVPVSQAVQSLYKKYHVALSGYVVAHAFERWDQEVQHGVFSLRVKYTLMRIAGTAA